MPEVSVALFTRDLRVRDNPVLVAAAASERVLPLFVVDEAVVASGYVCPNRATFLAQCLEPGDPVQVDRAGGRPLGYRVPGVERFPEPELPVDRLFARAGREVLVWSRAVATSTGRPAPTGRTWS